LCGEEGWLDDTGKREDGMLREGGSMGKCSPGKYADDARCSSNRNRGDEADDIQRSTSEM
jgi:hypothetical protein